MGLTRPVVSLATRRPRCYVVESPGGASQRMAVEYELDARGWRPSWSPASADALVIGGPLPDELGDAVALLWSQVAGPRVQVVVEDPRDAADALDGVRRGLADEDAQRREARDRAQDEASPWLGDHGDVDHGDMDHGDMDMAPGGVPLAEGAEDRDGLEMDVLVHPLGPLLDRWPGGLELRLTLHGDVVGDAEVSRWGSQGSESRRPVAAWDAVATTLSLIGDERGAREARRLRSIASDAGDVPPVRADRVRSRVRRLARWAVVPDVVATTLLDLVTPTPDPSPRPVQAPELVRGRDLADVRLLIASHAPLLATDEHEVVAGD